MEEKWLEMLCRIGDMADLELTAKDDRLAITHNCNELVKLIKAFHEDLWKGDSELKSTKVTRIEYNDSRTNLIATINFYVLKLYKYVDLQGKIENDPRSWDFMHKEMREYEEWLLWVIKRYRGIVNEQKTEEEAS